VRGRESKRGVLPGFGERLLLGRCALRELSLDRQGRCADAAGSGFDAVEKGDLGVCADVADGAERVERDDIAEAAGERRDLIDVDLSTGLDLDQVADSKAFGGPALAVRAREGIGRSAVVRELHRTV